MLVGRRQKSGRCRGEGVPADRPQRNCPAKAVTEERNLNTEANEASMPQRPVSAVPLRVGGIPAELKKLNRWILWKYTHLPKRNKWTKTPHSAKTGIKIDATNFDNGTDFVTAVKAWREKKSTFDGLGFLLGDGIAGIDVDDCLDEDRNMDERGERMSKAYAGTYAEYSPGGHGFKIIVNVGNDPKLASIGKKVGGLEIYGGSRYFTVTGALVPGHATHIAEMSTAFARTAEEMGINKHLAKAPDGPTDITEIRTRTGIDLKAARDLIDYLPFTWCDDYFLWLRAGMAFHHEFDGSAEALALWDEWSQRNPGKYDPQACAAKWLTFGKPGKDPVTLRSLIRDAQKNGWRPPRSIEEAVQEFSLLDDTPHIDPESGEAIADWWSRYSVGPMLRTTPQPLKWIWRSMLLESKVMLLAGSGGSSKSYLMLAAATQYALGESWGPFELHGDHDLGRVLVLYGEEDHADVHHRVHSLKHTFMLTDEQVARAEERMAVMPLRGQDVALVEYADDGRHVNTTRALERLEERIKQYKIRLLVLDPMAMLHGLEENDNLAMGHFIQELDAMCMRTGVAVVLIHHFSKAVAKAREVNEANVRGASSIVNHVRTVVVMHRLRRDESAEWGVPEDDHARWVMFNIVKNNYGRHGAVTWFNVNQNSGVILPAETQLTFMNSRDIRQAALNNLAQQSEQEYRDEQRRDEEQITEAEESRARQAAQRRIVQLRYMEMILRTSVDINKGKLLSMRQSRDIVLAQDASATGAAVRTAHEALRSEGLVTENGANSYVITERGHGWLEERELLQ